MKKNVIITVIVVVAIALIAILALNNQSQAPQPLGPTSAGSESINPAATTTGTVSTPVPGKSYTLAEVAVHKDATSCWTAVNGKVYDVTTWIARHPGGQAAILSICGKDGSAAFNDQHGGQARPASELASFYIGTLAK
jgi:cytochrome b involved in lipid metabolism